MADASDCSERRQTRDLRKTGLHPDHWHPLARSHEVPKGGAFATSFAGEPIVLVRPERGEIFALEDRCAHRQVPLSDGVVKGERVQCGYHCWTYDRTGRCVSVPYLDAERRMPNGVKSYPVREAYGFVFVYPGDPERLNEAVFPEIAAYDDPNYKTRTLDRRIGCHYGFMHENLMDMNHQFLHRRLMGKIRATLKDFERGENHVEARYTFARGGGRQSFGEKIMIGEPARTAQDHDRNLMVIRTEYPWQTLTFQIAGADGPALDLWNFYTPLDAAQRTNRTLGLMMIRKPKKLPPFSLNLLWPLVVWFTESIFAEDQDVVEAEQRAFDAQGADWNQEVFPAIRALKDLLRDRGLPIVDGPPAAPEIQLAELR